MEIAPKLTLKDSKQNVVKSVASPLVQPIDSTTPLSTMNKIVILIVYLILIGLGVGTGFLLTRNKDSSPVSKTEFISGAYGGGNKAVGVADPKEFPDTAIGTIEKNSGGEGTHKLLREGGDSQTAYLTSTIIDLDEFVGKKVKIWGRTYSAKKVSWLMDVGKLEVTQ